MLQEAATGIVIVLRHPSLRGLVACYALYQVSWGILLVAVPVLVAAQAADTHQADGLTGAVWAASGLAGGVGALLAGATRVINRERTFIALATLATAVSIYPICTLAGLVGLAGGVALVGFFSGPIDVGVLTLRQRRTDPRQLGRVLAVSMSLNMAGLPLGSAIGGMLMAHGGQPALAAAGVAAALSALACQWLIPAPDP